MSEIPKGHLEPLGSHRPPETDLVDELDEVPSPQVFWEKYVKPSRALVLRGAAKHSKAFKLWTDEYMKEKYGGLEVRLEMKSETSGRIPVGAKGVGRDTIEHFVNTYHDTNAYIVSELPTPMWPDISVQPCLLCSSFKDSLVEVDLWMSGGGSSSILHKDSFNAINCVYNGTKEWKLIEYKYENKIYKAWEPDREIGGFSRIDPLKVDLLKYPKVAKVPWSFVTINAGDCLFLPKSYYHQVTSYGKMNVAVALLFMRFDGIKDINMSGCHRNLSYTPLSELELDWPYPGHGNLSMGNPCLHYVRDIIKGAVQSRKNVEEFLHGVIKKWYPSEKPETWIQDKVKKIIKAAGFDKKANVTVEDVDRLGREELRAISLAIEPTDLGNTELHEYMYTHPHDIRMIVNRILNEQGSLERKRFVSLYKEVIGGTEKFAQEILSKLSTSPHTVPISREEVEANIADALAPFEANQREEVLPPGQTTQEDQDAYSAQDDGREEEREVRRDNAISDEPRDEL